MRQSSGSHKIDFDIKNVRVRLLIIHKEQFHVFFSCVENVEYFRVYGEGEKKKEK